MVLSLVLALTVGVQPPASATKLTVTPSAAAVVAIDVGKLKGDLVRLAWSPDATVVYLQTVERDSRGGVKLRHFLVGLDGAPPKGTDGEPPWAAKYWAWKSAQAAPGLPALRISVDQQQKRMTATSTPAGGDLARGDPGGSAMPGPGSSSGMSVSEAARAAEQSQMVNVFTLKLRDEIVGEFVNAPALPGLTFGWGPSGSGLIAFAHPKGQLVVMDNKGTRIEVPGSKAALLPAWTDDGKRLAWLERTGKKKVALRLAHVTIP